MSVWNPNAFTAHGEGVGAVVPPGLRVRGGGEASSAQMRAAQTVFANYCDLQRVSAGPNPQQLGNLPDGTPYRITTVGNTTNMEVWPTGSSEQPDRGGIGIVLVDLEGQPIPGHIHRDGFSPQPYLLTPGIQKDRQTSTGEWQVRKVDGFQGGKVVQRYKRTNMYLTGVGGRSWASLPPQRASDMSIGLPSRSLRYGSFERLSPIYNNRRQIARSSSEYDMVPFYRMDAKKRLWVMRINIQGPVVELYGVPAPVPNNGEIADLLATLQLPGSVLDATYTVSPDGNRLIVGATGGPTGRQRVTINIGDKSLNISSTSPILFQDPIYENKTEIIEKTIVHGKTQYDSRCQISFPEYIEYTTVTQGTNIFDSNVKSDIASWSGYNVKGKINYVYTVIDNRRTGITITTEVIREWYAARLPSDHPDTCYYTPPYISTHKETSITIKGTVTNKQAYLGHGTTDQSYYEKYVYWDTSQNIIHKEGKQEEWTSSWIYQIFYDELFDVRVDILQNRHMIWMVGEPIPTEEITRSLSVSKNGVSVLDIALNDDTIDSDHFVCPSANDPLTGALCFNVLQFTNQLRAKVMRSWIFVVDDQGIKPLSQIMSIPAGSGVRIQSDSTLMCV